jgi:hypothetical protein
MSMSESIGLASGGILAGGLPVHAAVKHAAGRAAENWDGAGYDSAVTTEWLYPPVKGVVENG